MNDSRALWIDARQLVLVYCAGFCDAGNAGGSGGGGGGGGAGLNSSARSGGKGGDAHLIVEEWS